MNDSINDYLTRIKDLIITGGNVAKEKPRTELSPKEKKKCKSCKYYKKYTYGGYCEHKGCSRHPLTVACDEYIKRKK